MLRHRIRPARDYSLNYAGRPEEGLAMIEKAERLKPIHPSNFAFHKGQAQFITASGASGRMSLLTPWDSMGECDSDPARRLWQ
jgi:hypothetical protein